MDYRGSNNFDLIRLFAAVSVMVLHIADHFHSHIPLVRLALDPFPGVPIFFVVSGFLISRSWERNPFWYQYLRNRFLRIYPALWVCFLLSLMAVVVSGYEFDAAIGKILTWVVAQLTIGQFYTPTFLNDFGVGVLNGSLWTIPVELQFYLVLPLILLWRPMAWIALAISLLAYATILDASLSLPGGISLAAQVTLLPNFYMFAVGILAARYWDKLMPFLVRRAGWWFVAYLCAIALASVLGARVGTNHPNPLLMIVLGGLVLSCAYSAPNLSKWLLRDNDISYGVYIYHMVVVNVMITANAIDYAGAVAATMTLAVLSWFLVERPALSLKRLSLRR